MGIGHRSLLYNTEIIGNLYSELAFGVWLHGDIFVLKLRPLKALPEPSAAISQPTQNPRVDGVS